MTPSIRERIMRGAGANAIATIVSIVALLVSVPLFLSFWDRERYGIWLMIIAIPVYFQMLDGGFVASAMNEIVMRDSRGDVSGAQRVLSAALGLTTSVIAVSAILAALIIIWLPLDFLDNPTCRASLLLLVVSSLLSLYTGLYDAVFRCAHRYAQGVLIMQSVRLAELIVTGAALWMGAGFIQIATAIASVQIIHLIVVQRYLRQVRPDLHWQFNIWDQKTFGPLLGPGLAWMGFRVSDGLVVQGTTLIVGASMGGSAAVTFFTLRTMSRLLFQFNASLGNALWPEITRLHATGEHAAIRATMLRIAFLSLILTATGIGFILLLAPTFLHFWTHGNINVDWTLLGILLLQSLFLSLWYIPRIYMAAINQIRWLSMLTLALYSAALIWGSQSPEKYGAIKLISFITAADALLCVVFWWSALKKSRSS